MKFGGAIVAFFSLLQYFGIKAWRRQALDYGVKNWSRTRKNGIAFRFTVSAVVLYFMWNWRLKCIYFAWAICWDTGWEGRANNAIFSLVYLFRWVLSIMYAIFRCAIWYMRRLYLRTTLQKTKFSNLFLKTKRTDKYLRRIGRPFEIDGTRSLRRHNRYQ